MARQSKALITAVPGLLSRLVAEQLLASESETGLYCVVKDEDETRAKSWLSTLHKDHRSRTTLLAGDPSAMDMGLSGKEFATVTSEIDRIYQLSHAAGAKLDGRIAEYVNVQGACELIEMALACKHLRCSVALSTAYVAGGRTGVVAECDLDNGQQFRSIEEQTSARAERILRRAMAKVPIAVVRPTSVVGHSKSGEIDSLDGTYGWMSLMVSTPPDVALPLPARSNEPLNLVPIDYLAAIVYLAGCDSASAGKTFHVADPHPLTAARVCELVAQVVGRRCPRGRLSPRLTKAVLQMPGIRRLLRNPSALFDLMITPVAYDCSNTTILLRGTGVECPPLESYLQVLVQFLQEGAPARRGGAQPATAAGRTGVAEH